MLPNPGIQLLDLGILKPGLIYFNPMMRSLVKNNLKRINTIALEKNLIDWAALTMIGQFAEELTVIRKIEEIST
ncbi:MAG: hypothetical protein AAF383_01515 [Cyanobacteria bacterium P01_A01_bin.83]